MRVDFIRRFEFALFFQIIHKKSQFIPGKKYAKPRSPVTLRTAIGWGVRATFQEYIGGDRMSPEAALKEWNRSRNGPPPEADPGCILDLSSQKIAK